LEKKTEERYKKRGNPPTERRMGGGESALETTERGGASRKNKLAALIADLVAGKIGKNDRGGAALTKSSKRKKIGQAKSEEVGLNSTENERKGKKGETRQLEKKPHEVIQGGSRIKVNHGKGGPQGVRGREG